MTLRDGCGSGVRRIRGLVSVRRRTDCHRQCRTQPAGFSSSLSPLLADNRGTVAERSKTGCHRSSSRPDANLIQNLLFLPQLHTLVHHSHGSTFHCLLCLSSLWTFINSFQILSSCWLWNAMQCIPRTSSPTENRRRAVTHTSWPISTPEAWTLERSRCRTRRWWQREGSILRSLAHQSVRIWYPAAWSGDGGQPSDGHVKRSLKLPSEMSAVKSWRNATRKPPQRRFLPRGRR